MVFEDDVILHPAFRARLAAAMRAADALAPGWLVFLGGADAKVPDRFFRDPGPLVALPSTTAEGYVTDLEACRRRVAWCDANKITLPADQLKAMQATIPMNRLGTPDECAGTFVYLASDEAAFVTGVILPVDGGRMVG